jgi:hypothetical protein
MLDESWAKVEAAVQDLPVPEQKKVLGRLSDYIRQKERSQEPPEQRAARRRKAWLETIEILKSLPPEGPDDGFSGRDHDKILYGGQW